MTTTMIRAASATITAHSACTDCGCFVSIGTCFFDLPCDTHDQDDTVIRCGPCQAIHIYGCRPCREEIAIAPTPRVVCLTDDDTDIGEPDDTDWRM